MSRSTHSVQFPNGFSADEFLEQAADFYPHSPAKAQSWLITAQSIFQDHFRVQFTTYKWHLAERRSCPAAKIFSHITNNIQGAFSNDEFKEQIMLLTNSVRCRNKNCSEEEAKYVAVFDSLEHDVQRKILLFALERVDIPLHKVHLLLLILNRYSYEGWVNEVEELSHVMVDCYLKDPVHLERMLIEDTLPLVDRMRPKLTTSAVNGLFTITMEFYTRKITEEERKPKSTDMWKSVFQILQIFSHSQGWPSFMAFNNKNDYSVYWDKLLAIMSVAPAGSNCVLCYATVLFLYCLHSYMKRCKAESDEVSYILMEGFADLMGTSMRSEILEKNAMPEITTSTDIIKKIASAFVVATKCWQLLNSDQFGPEFAKIICSLHVSQWMPAFTLDMSQYFGFRQEAVSLIIDKIPKSTSDLIINLKKLSIILICGKLTPNAMQLVVNILSDLPKRQGNLVKLLREDVKRHVIFLPMERCAIVQYCCRAIIEHLRWTKFVLPNCSMKTMIHMMILSQLEFPFEYKLAYDLLHWYDAREYLLTDNAAPYITNLYMLGEICDIYRLTPYSNNGDDVDIVAYVNAQKSRANENVVDLMVAFIINEMNAIMCDLFISDSRDYQLVDTDDDSCEISFDNSQPTRLSAPMEFSNEQQYSMASDSNALLIDIPEYTESSDTAESGRVNRVNEHCGVQSAPIAMPVSVITNNIPSLPPLTAMPVCVITPTPSSQFVTATTATDMSYSHGHEMIVQSGMNIPAPLVAANLTAAEDCLDLFYIN